MAWQVVEKEDYGTDWHQVRYEAYAMQRFNTEDEAVTAAKQYLTHTNCDNALAKDEKFRGAEAFMMTEQGCFMGVLDGEDWYVLDRHKNPVKDARYFELEGKTEVSVRKIRGT